MAWAFSSDRSPTSLLLVRLSGSTEVFRHVVSVDQDGISTPQRYERPNAPHLSLASSSSMQMAGTTGPAPAYSPVTGERFDYFIFVPVKWLRQRGLHLHLLD
jgi:hypothetical protein